MQDRIQKAKDRLDTSDDQHFDSQGFFVFTEGVGLNASSSTAVHVSCNQEKLNEFIVNLASKITNTQNENLNPLLTQVYTNQPQAITNLERVFSDKFAQISRSYQIALNNQYDQQIDEAFQETIKSSMPKIREKFIESLKKSISSDCKLLDLKKLNLQLDAEKESIYKEMRKEFATQCDLKKIPKADYDKLEEALHTTPAFKNFEILEITPHSSNYIKTPEKSSHDFSPNTDADEPITHYDKNGAQKYKVVRSPIPIPPKKWYKENKPNLTTAEIKEQQINDTVERLKRISDKNGFAADKPIYECLLTSFHTGFKIWDGNEQTDRANLLPTIQDKFNQDRQGNNLFFPYLIPTNGFGEEIAVNSGNSEIEELAWRNNMALAMQLGTVEQKTEISAKYQAFLADPSKKLALQAYIKTVQTNMQYVEGDPKEKTLLKIMFKHNLHEKKQFARTTATLFCANADNQVIVGCKSGNERTAMILHRLDALYDGPKGGAIEKFTANNRGEQYQELGDFYNNCLKYPAVAEERLIKFTKAIEEQVNSTNLYGTANHISSKDTGFDHKIAPNSGYSLSTNAAESSSMTNLITGYNEKLQAHKDNKPLADLVESKPGFFQTFYNYFFGSNDSNEKTEPSLSEKTSPSLWERFLSLFSSSDSTQYEPLDSREDSANNTSAPHSSMDDIEKALGIDPEQISESIQEDDESSNEVPVSKPLDQESKIDLNPNSESDSPEYPRYQP